MVSFPHEKNARAGMNRIESHRSAWTAPEVTFLDQLTSKSDVWAYGVLVWELMTLGATPIVNGNRD
jgi:serine/threonine protein kinase